MPDPKKIGKDIDEAIERLAAADKLAEIAGYYMQVPLSLQKALAAYTQTKEQDDV